MEHFYKKIQGWFCYQDVYTKIVNELPNNAHIVEIGAWKGSSTAYLAVEIINSGKNIVLDVVDDWKGGGDAAALYYNDAEYSKCKGDIFELFKRNVKPVIDRINIVRCLSTEAVLKYDDKSLDFVYIDANHAYEYVKQDIELWLPKIKCGGTLAGHDYNVWEGVNKAVHEKFQDKFELMGSTWLIKL